MHDRMTCVQAVEPAEARLVAWPVRWVAFCLAMVVVVQSILAMAVSELVKSRTLP